MNNDQPQNDTTAEQQPDEMSLLKQRATMMGIKFSNNIGLEALKAKIAEKMDGVTSTEAAAPDALNPLAGDKAGQAPVTQKTLRQQLLEEQMKMVRVRITCLDPKKKDLHGEILTVANEYIGTVRKFVPYGEATEDGYHIPHILYKLLDSRKFLSIRSFKDKRTGHQRVESSWAKEFAIEVLPQLTQAELNRLATAQAAAGSLNND